MKKIIQILITFSILFLGINGVKANITKTYEGTCNLKSKSSSECLYSCNTIASSDSTGLSNDSELTFDYHVYFENGNIKYEIVNNTIDTGANSYFGKKYNGLHKGNDGVDDLTKLVDNPVSSKFVSNNKFSCPYVHPSVEVLYTSNIPSVHVGNNVGIRFDSAISSDSEDNNQTDTTCGFLGSKDSQTVTIFRKVYKYLKVLIPVLIILLGFVDFIKVVVTGKDDDMKKAIDRFVKRIIVAIIFVLVPVLVQFFINISGLASQYSGINDGIRAILCILD